MPISTYFRSNLYRAIWRWHFYAGLIALPFLILLSITGALYLFKDEINSTLFSARTHVAAYETSLPASALIQKAEAIFPGSKALSFSTPLTETHSASVILNDQNLKKIIWLNPANGNILDTSARDDEFNTVVKHLHSLDYFGSYANALIEIIAAFTLILVVTGFYLWWPRRQSGGVVTVRSTPKKRVFWRDVHAVSGAASGALIFFLALTGMPWSGFWGERAHAIADAQGWGYPQGMWDNVPNSDMHANHMVEKTSWTLATSPMPKSLTRPSDTQSSPIDVDRALQIAQGQGLAKGYQLNLPRDHEGVYTASVFPENLSQQQLVHIDQYSGAVLINAGFKDYGTAAQAIEFGINTHMGQQFGRFNQLLMLMTCLAILLSCATAAVMWWKRRPQGRLGVPPAPREKKIYITLGCVMLVFGVIFPLSGLAILIMLALDLLLIRNIPVLRRVFS